MQLVHIAGMTGRRAGPSRMPAVLAAGILVLGLASDRAGADGFMLALRSVGRTADPASPKQEALLRPSGASVELVLRTHFRRGPEEVAWIVPVPGRPDVVRALEDDPFAELDERTAPRFAVYERRARGWGCGCASRQLDVGRSNPLRSTVVTVHELGRAGVAEYAVLESSDADALRAWLDGHGYVLPADANPVVERYAAMGWCWLAMRLAPDVGGDESVVPQPISVVFPAERVVFPLVISGISAAPVTEVVLYVAADRRYECAGWSNVALGSSRLGDERLEPDAAAPSGSNYEAAVGAATAAAGGHLFVTEYAARWNADEAARLLPAPAGDSSAGPVFVTRLRAIVAAADLDRDVELVATDRGPLPRRGDDRVVTLLAAGGSAGGPALAGAGLAGLLLAAAGRRRRRLTLALGGAALLLI
ncbi:MAG: DUF2330 domain-containing protein [Planctomycetota bacterium]|jgi:hypothetical protein